jgi:hypothetical protein
MTFKLGWSSQLDEQIGFGGGSVICPLKQTILGKSCGHGEKGKRNIFVFIKERIQDMRMN